MDYKIILAAKVELAKAFKETNDVYATVEAEYGDTVIEGTHVTLAHHCGPYANHPAPCCREDIEKAPEGSTILVSHIDLDTVGGCLALMGLKAELCTKEFWDGAGYIDTSGPHRLGELDTLVRRQLQACYAWEADNTVVVSPIKVTDVTEHILKYGKAIEAIGNRDVHLLSRGDARVAAEQRALEKRLIEECPRVRVYASTAADGFTPAGYYSPKYEQIIPATVTFNTETKAITIAFEDGGKKTSARDLVTNIWGPDAGGHPGIAGSPRGQEMSLHDLLRAVTAVRNSFEK